MLMLLAYFEGTQTWGSGMLTYTLVDVLYISTITGSSNTTSTLSAIGSVPRTPSQTNEDWRLLVFCPIRRSKDILAQKNVLRVVSKSPPLFTHPLAPRRRSKATELPVSGHNIAE